MQNAPGPFTISFHLFPHKVFLLVSFGWRNWCIKLQDQSLAQSIHVTLMRNGKCSPKFLHREGTPIYTLRFQAVVFCWIHMQWAWMLISMLCEITQWFDSEKRSLPQMCNSGWLHHALATNVSWQNSKLRLITGHSCISDSQDGFWLSSFENYHTPPAQPHLSCYIFDHVSWCCWQILTRSWMYHELYWKDKMDASPAEKPLNSIGYVSRCGFLKNELLRSASSILWHYRTRVASSIFRDIQDAARSSSCPLHSSSRPIQESETQASMSCGDPVPCLHSIIQGSIR